MVLIPLLPVGAVVGVLGISAITNMRQTIDLQKRFETNTIDSDDKSSILSCYLQTDTNGPPNASIPTDKTTSEVIRDLERMKRDELFTLFLSCVPPTELKQIQGEWDGLLLENNGLVMTKVGSFLSNTLFGRGRKWNGKAFLGVNPEESLASGTNRFLIQSDTQPSKTSIFNNHNFDYCLKASTFGRQSIGLCYAKYQSLLSPWKTMKDEVRVLRMPSSETTNENGGILIGVGWMAWSGGSLNCQPFCLIQSNEKQLKDR